MNWKLKAAIQNAVSLLPSSASYEMYYWLQRNFGGLKKVNPMGRLYAGIETWNKITGVGFTPKGKVFFEVGTGRVPVVPMAFWLMGAEKIITIDKNPYLKEELIKENILYISENIQEIQKLFGNLLDKKRFEMLINFDINNNFSMKKFLDLCKIKYIAPGDASNTDLDSNSIDFHTSFTVFEHIPPTVLQKIIEEGNRIVNPNGLFVHRIDYSDHFSHSDTSISKINFLQFSEAEWNKLAGNRYMYMNRLRHDDFINMFQSLGHNILKADTDEDAQAQEILRKGDLQINEQFKSKPENIISISGSWIISQKSKK